MKRKKTILSLVLMITLLLSVVTACNQEGTTKQSTVTTASTTKQSGETTTGETPSTTESGDDLEPANLRVWAHWGSEQRRPTVTKMIEGFNKLYADQGIVAEYVYVPFGDLETKLIASVTAGNPPNAAVTAIEDVGIKAMRKQSTDITDYLQEGTRELFYEKYFDAVVWNDRIYALPFNTDTRLLFVNAKMLGEIGMPTAEDFKAQVKTWDDLYALSEKLDKKNPDGTYEVLTFVPNIGNFGFGTMIVNNGGGIFDDPINPDKPIVNCPQNIEVLDYMKKWADHYGQNEIQSLLTSGVGASDHFLSGKVAIFGNVCNYIATIDKYGKTEGNEPFEYYAVPMPAGPSAPNGQFAAWGGGFVVNVPYGASHPRESTRFAEYFCGNEASTIWAIEQKDVMCNIVANENPELNKDPAWAAVLEIMPFTQSTRRHPFAPNAGSVVDEAVNKIVRDFTETDTKKVLDEAQAAIEKMIEDEKAIWG